MLPEGSSENEENTKIISNESYRPLNSDRFRILVNQKLKNKHGSFDMQRNNSQKDLGPNHHKKQTEAFKKNHSFSKVPFNNIVKCKFEKIDSTPVKFQSQNDQNKKLINTGDYDNQIKPDDLHKNVVIISEPTEEIQDIDYNKIVYHKKSLTNPNTQETYMDGMNIFTTQDVPESKTKNMYNKSLKRRNHLLSRKKMNSINS